MYAIEASGVAQVCRQIVEQNNLQDRITVIHDKVENASLPAGVKADVIISEWMGFYLLHESMLDSVIVAREKWLKSDGCMFPSSATLYLCPVNMKKYVEENWNFWSDVYGFDFSPVLPLVKQKAESSPIVTTVQPDQLLAEPQVVLNLDLLFVTQGDLRNIQGTFDFPVKANSVLHGFASWFEVEFEGGSISVLDTGPSAAKTHWEQTVMFLPHPLLVSKQDTVACRLTMTQDSNNCRLYNICIELDEGEDSDDAYNTSDVENEHMAKNELLKAMGHEPNS